MKSLFLYYFDFILVILCLDPVIFKTVFSYYFQLYSCIKLTSFLYDFWLIILRLFSELKKEILSQAQILHQNRAIQKNMIKANTAIGYTQERWDFFKTILNKKFVQTLIMAWLTMSYILELKIKYLVPALVFALY